MILRSEFLIYLVVASLLDLSAGAGYYWNNRAPTGNGDDFDLDQIRQYLSRHHQLDGLNNRQRFYNPFHNYFYPDQQQQQEPPRHTSTDKHEDDNGHAQQQQQTSTDATVHFSRVESLNGEVVPDDVTNFKSHARHTRPSQDVPEVQVMESRRMPNSADRSSDVFFIAVVAGCSAAAVFGVVAAGFCWYRIQKSTKAAAEADYPAYGVTGPNKDTSPGSNGDRKLVQSAHMYHYHHQKQQMIAMEKATTERHVSTSDIDSDEDNEEGDYTVYECPGLAPTGEMEVKNPLFQDDTTASESHQTISSNKEQQ